MQLKVVAFRAARSRPAGAIVRVAFARAERLLPLERLARHQRVTLYRHPRPAYAQHLLAVPRVAVPDVFRLADEHHASLRRELWDALSMWADRFAAPWITINAGPRQDVHQAHFHLTATRPPELVTDLAVLGRWETAVRAAASHPDRAAWTRTGFALVCAPDGTVVACSEARHAGG